MTWLWIIPAWVTMCVAIVFALAAVREDSWKWTAICMVVALSLQLSALATASLV